MERHSGNPEGGVPLSPIPEIEDTNFQAAASHHRRYASDMTEAFSHYASSLAPFSRPRSRSEVPAKSSAEQSFQQLSQSMSSTPQRGRKASLSASSPFPGLGITSFRGEDGLLESPERVHQNNWELIPNTTSVSPHRTDNVAYVNKGQDSASARPASILRTPSSTKSGSAKENARSPMPATDHRMNQITKAARNLSLSGASPATSLQPPTRASQAKPSVAHGLLREIMGSEFDLINASNAAQIERIFDRRLAEYAQRETSALHQMLGSRPASAESDLYKTQTATIGPQLSETTPPPSGAKYSAGTSLGGRNTLSGSPIAVRQTLQDEQAHSQTSRGQEWRGNVAQEQRDSPSVGGGGGTDVSSTTPSNSGLSLEHQRRARELVNLIKSGTLETNSPLSRSARSASPYAHSATSVQSFHQPLANSTRRFGNNGNRAFRAGGPPHMSSQVNFQGVQLDQPSPVMSQPILNDPYVAFLKEAGPTFAELMENVPLIDHCLEATRVDSGVIKITQIPYSATRKEISAIFGRTPDFVKYPLNNPTHPAASEGIHIIMERSTGKSMDAYVEFTSPEAAQSAMNRFHRSGNGSYSSRVRDRTVTLKLVPASEMMKDIFPRAKCVEWMGCEPQIIESKDVGYVTNGFSGFTTSEEHISLSRLASQPNRSKYAINHPQRVYESMISIIVKFPWHRIDVYSIKERNGIVKCFTEMINSLTQRHIFSTKDENKNLNNFLLEELSLLAHFCPGFNDKQRAAIVDITFPALGPPPRPLTILAGVWPFECLSKHAEASDEYMVFFANVLAEGYAKVNDIPANAIPPMITSFGHFQIIHGAHNNETRKMSEVAAAESEQVTKLLKETLPAGQFGAWKGVPRQERFRVFRAQQRQMPNFAYGFVAGGYFPGF